MLASGQHHIGVELCTVTLLHFKKTDIGIFQGLQASVVGVGTLHVLLVIESSRSDAQIVGQHFGAQIKLVFVVDGKAFVMQWIIHLDAVLGGCLQHIIIGNETHFIDSVLPVILRRILVMLSVWSQMQCQIYQIRITDSIRSIGYVLFIELVISILKQFVCDALAFCIQYIDIKIHAFG